VTPAECRAIAARAIASGAIKVVPARTVDVRAVVKHDDRSAERVLARYGKTVRAVAKEHGLDVAAVAGRSQEPGRPARAERGPLIPYRSIRQSNIVCSPDTGPWGDERNS